MIVRVATTNYMSSSHRRIAQTSNYETLIAQHAAASDLAGRAPRINRRGCGAPRGLHAAVTVLLGEAGSQQLVCYVSSGGGCAHGAKFS